ncbi:MAG: hypothetical protein OHK0045_05160 [Raineya sp.]
MKSFLKYIFTLQIFVLQTFAQTYTDYKPQYKEWNKDYIIDKIEYTDTRMIVHFRYIARISELDIAMGVNQQVDIFGKEHEERWCLENVANPDETFYIIDVKNIRRNGMLKNASIAGNNKLRYEHFKPNEVLTCEIHFKRLPNRVKMAHLLEGKYKKYDSNHFHAFNIKLKTENDDLGSFEDMVLRVHTFERRMTGRPQSTFVIPNKKQNTPEIVKKAEPPKPKAPLLSPPQKPEYPQEAQIRM